MTHSKCIFPRYTNKFYYHRKNTTVHCIVKRVREVIMSCTFWNKRVSNSALVKNEIKETTIHGVEDFLHKLTNTSKVEEKNIIQYETHLWEVRGRSFY